MLVHSFRLALQMVGALGIVLGAAVGYTTWLLSKGPISIPAAVPYLEEALSAGDGSFRIGIGEAVVTWAGWERHLDVKVLDVSLFDGEGALVAAIPELVVTVSGSALLQRTLALRGIEILQPSLAVDLSPEGAVRWGFESEPGGSGNTGEEPSGELTDTLLALMNNPPTPSQPLSFLRWIRVKDANLTVRDSSTGTDWWAPGTQIEINRNASGVQARATLAIRTGSETIRLAGEGNYLRDSGHTRFSLSVNGLDPVILADAIPELADLKRFDFLLKGGMAGELDRRFDPLELSFDLAAGRGSVLLPAPLHQRLNLRTAALKGRLNLASGDVEISAFDILFQEGTRLALPAPAAHRMPIRSLSGLGGYSAEDRKLTVGAFTLDFGGPRTKLSGTVTGIGGDMQVQATGALLDTTVDDLPKYWPPQVAPPVLEWISEHLSGGAVSEASLQLAANVAADGTAHITRLDGAMKMAGIAVDYLPPMPRVVDAAGTATFNEKSFTIEVSSGRTETGLTVNSGTLKFLDLQQDLPLADIALNISGPVPAALGVLDSEPLAIGSTFGFDANTAGGSAETDLRLQFPLLKDLALSQLDYQANATLNGMRLPNWVLGLNLSRGNLQLDVDKEGLDVTGSARLGSMPLRLQWRRNFGDKIPYRERFLVRGTVQQSQLVREIGLNFPPFAGGYLRGSVAANLVVTRQDSGRTAIIGDLDLTESQLHNPVFAWNKAPGENAHGKFELILQGGKVRSLNRFSLAGAGLKVEGTASFNRQGTNITRLNLTELSQGRNNATVTLTPDEGSGWLLEVNGDSFDLSPLRDDLLAAGGGGGGGVTDPISATINLQHVWMTPTRGVENVMGTFRYDGQKWIFGNIEGNLKEGGAILLGLTSKERERQVRVRSSNAGAALRALDVYDSISGGSLALDAVLADAEPDSPLRGKLVLTSFRLLDAPVMARLLSLAALTGILESLGGEGLAFNRLELPFSKAGSTLRISEGQAYGLSLGITASGRINVASNAVSLTGTIVPAYAINSALGRIPLLGTIVTGGETGSGLFAATYSVGGTLSAPEASIQPLSALAPGFLRNLFNLEEEEEALPAQAPAEPESLRPFDR